MKSLAPSFLLALLALTGCGAAEGLDAIDAEFADDAVDADGAPALGAAQQALISGGVSGGLDAKPWCAARKTCYDKCGADFPRGGGPLSTCKKICDKTTESKCRPGFSAGGGVVIF